MLRTTHSHVRVTAEVWEGMTESEKHTKKKRCFVLDPKIKTVTSSNGRVNIVTRPDAGKKKNQRKRKRTAKTFTPRKRKN